jgi:hypothetical protein
MNEINNMNVQNMIKTYLKDVKKALPDWLKEKKEHKEILADLEEHLWQKASELSDNNEPTEESVNLAIKFMGKPETIAKEYKRRGEPKVYITKEMWPLYIKVLSIVFAVIFGLQIVGLIVSALTELVSFWDMIGELFWGIQSGLLFSFTIVTVIFIVLSMEGYFPEDFQSKKDQKKYRESVEQAAEEGFPISKSGKPMKPFIKPIGEIIGGGIALIFGLIFLIQPFPAVIFFPEFLLLMRGFGLVWLIEGCLDISRGIMGNHHPKKHQIIHGFLILTKLAAIPLLVILMNRPDIFPIFSEMWVPVGIPVEFYGTYRGIVAVVIVIVCLTTIEDFYRIAKLQKYK